MTTSKEATWTGRSPELMNHIEAPKFEGKIHGPHLWVILEIIPGREIVSMMMGPEAIGK